MVRDLYFSIWMPYSLVMNLLNFTCPVFTYRPWQAVATYTSTSCSSVWPHEGPQEVDEFDLGHVVEFLSVLKQTLVLLEIREDHFDDDFDLLLRQFVKEV